MFEAKNCKVKQNGRWDQVTHTTTYSHFTDQLIRQKKWSHQFARWEMFQNNYPNGHTSPYNFLNYGSTCVWHQHADNYAHANNYKKARKRWTNKELESLLKSSSENIAEIIYEILICHKGKKLTVKEKYGKENTVESISVEANDGKEIHLPFPKSNEAISEDISNEPEVLKFMIETGLTRYIYFDITEESLKYLEEIVHRTEESSL